MMESRIYRSVLFLMVMGFCSCRECSLVESVNTITIKNNSDKHLVVLLSDLYPDTLVPLSPRHIAGLLPNKQTLFDTRMEWEEFFADLPADTLSIFFIEVGIYDTVAPETIRSQNLILQRKDWSLQDIKDNGYVIRYP